MFRVILGYTAMWLSLFGAAAAAFIGGSWWTDRPAIYVLIMYGLAFGLLCAAGWFQSYAATWKMVLDDEPRLTEPPE